MRQESSPTDSFGMDRLGKATLWGVAVFVYLLALVVFVSSPSPNVVGFAFLFGAVSVFAVPIVLTTRSRIEFYSDEILVVGAFKSHRLVPREVVDIRGSSGLLRIEVDGGKTIIVVGINGKMFYKDQLFDERIARIQAAFASMSAVP